MVDASTPQPFVIIRDIYGYAHWGIAQQVNRNPNCVLFSVWGLLTIKVVLTQTKSVTINTNEHSMGQTTWRSCLNVQQLCGWRIILKGEIVKHWRFLFILFFFCVCVVKLHGFSGGP